eukprot:262662-Pleurochrysis_carterae.AAC.1
MTNVRELTKTVNGNEVIGQWCSEGGRRTNPEACNNAYATTFPSNAFAPGYFSTPPIYRAPNVREQRQRCVHNNLEGDAARCSMDSKQYQCAVRTSVCCRPLRTLLDRVAATSVCSRRSSLKSVWRSPTYPIFEFVSS